MLWGAGKLGLVPQDLIGLSWSDRGQVRSVTTGKLVEWVHLLMVLLRRREVEGSRGESPWRCPRESPGPLE